MPATRRSAASPAARMRRRRWAAFAALALGLAALGLSTAQAIVGFPRSTIASVLLLPALAAGWHGLVRRGALHVVGLAVGALLTAVMVGLQMAVEPMLGLCTVVALGLALASGGYAFRAPVALAPAPRPKRPVVFWNPRSGGGKALRFHLADEARARGIEPVELRPGDDLEQLVREALHAGADALAVAGGDGSQATAARIAAERGIPFACIPAGTRNHFARDLGVDPSDVVGALDAFVDGGERVVDLGEANGRVFVNNVSLGVYGRAVQRTSYRDAKLRTLLETVPSVVGLAAHPDLQWRGPDGAEHRGGAAIVVSNNRYRLGRVLGDGTRPRLDEGQLGIVVLGAPGDEPGARMWCAPTYEVSARGELPAGVDGEAVVFEAPLRFSIRRAALRCRVARHHPGASASAFLPDSALEALRTLIGIAAGHDPRPVPGARLREEVAARPAQERGRDDGAPPNQSDRPARR